LNDQRPAFARIVWLGQDTVPLSWLLNTGTNGYDNRASDLYQLSAVAQMGVLHGLMNRWSIMMTMLYRVLDCRQDQTKPPMEQGDFLLSDGEDEQSWSGQWNEGTPLKTFNQHNFTNWCKLGKWYGEWVAIEE
jgi:hypothetical protein